MLTPQQERAIRYYIGDVEGEDPFWGDPKAYVLLNALFFPGLDTERRRCAEGKRLSPALLEDEERLLGLLRSLLGAFRPLGAPLTTFRVERYADFTVMRRRARTVSPTSTSTAGFLDAYRDRRGIALLEFSLPAGTPCLHMAQILPGYAKPGEAEVLLPPGLPLAFREAPLTPAQQGILDADGAPPRVFCHVQAVPAPPHPVQEAPLPPGGAAAGSRVVRALGAGQEPDPADVRAYLEWKAALAAQFAE